MGEEKKLWQEPEYFDLFACKCGECRNTCCKGWKIAVGREEYFRMIGMDCSEELHNKLESTFYEPEFPTPERFRCIEPDWRGQCRILGEDGLCMLQKECGEAAIPETCRVYPRSYKQKNNRFVAVCSASCEAVVELLMKNDSLGFEMKVPKKDIRPEIVETLPSDAEILGDRTVEILKDANKPLCERIREVGQQLGENRHADLALPGLLEALGKLTETSDTLKEYAETVFERYGAAGEKEEQLYKEDLKTFTGRFPKWEIYFTNFMVNNVVYSSFPYCDKRIGIKDSYPGLVLQYELLKLVCAGYTAEDWSEERLVDSVAAIYHLIEHTSYYYNASLFLKLKNG